MSQKYTLELYSDAAIVQKGSQAEQLELRRLLQSQIDSWNAVYGENGIESLWNKLGKINLGDSKIRADITAFIAAERRLKGGNAGPEFEDRFKILEKYFTLADAARAGTDKKRGEVVVRSRESELELRSMQHGSDSRVAPSANNSKPSEAASEREPNSVAYSREFLKKSKAQLDVIKEKLQTSQPKLFVLLESAIKNPTPQAVLALQTEIRKILPSANVSRNGAPDGWFGPLTLEALQKIAQPTSLPSTPPAAAGSAASSSPSASAPSPGQPASAPAAAAADSAGSTAPRETLSSFPTGRQVFFKDGAYYLTGPKGTPTRVEYGDILTRFGIPKEAGANLMKSTQQANNFALLLEAYAQMSPENQKKAQAAATALEAKMKAPDIQSGTTVLNIDWEVLNFLQLPGSTKTGPRPDSVAQKVASMFTSLANPVEQRAKITQFIREEFNQYDLVANDIINRKWNGNIGAVSDEYFMKMATDIQGGNAVNTTSEYKILYEKIGADGLAKVMNAVKKASADSSEDWEKNSKIYVEQFKKQTGFSGNIDQVQLAKARDAYRASSIASIAKKEIMYQYLSKDAGLMGGKSQDIELKTLEGILGVGKLRMSDRALDITGEAAQFLAIEALAIGVGVFTAGIGTVAINAAAFGRHAYRGAQLAEAYGAASKTKQALVWGARAVGGMGVGFEVGAAGTRSLYEGKNMYSKEGFAQSIAMGVVLGGLGSYFRSAKAPAFLKFKDGAGVMKNTIPFTSQVVIEGTAMGVAAGTIGTFVFEKGHAWSPEEMGQAILMAALFKGASRVSFRKGPQNEIIAEEVAPTTPTTPATPRATTPETPSATTPSAPRADTMSAFTTREISGADVRRVRKQMKANPELSPQFISQDGSVWSVRKISGSNGKETLEIGPLGQPSAERTVSINDFVEGVNANVRKWKESTPAAPAPTPAAPAPTPAAPAPAPAAPAPAPAAPAAQTLPAKSNTEIIKSILDFNFTKKDKGIGKFFNDFVLMRPNDTPVLGAVSNTVRQPLVAGRNLLNIWLNDPKAMKFAAAEGEKVIKANVDIFTDRTLKSMKVALFGTENPGYTNGTIVFLLMMIWAATEVRNNNAGKTVSNQEITIQAIKEYFHNMYVDMPEMIIDSIVKFNDDFSALKAPNTNPNSFFR